MWQIARLFKVFLHLELFFWFADSHNFELCIITVLIFFTLRLFRFYFQSMSRSLNKEPKIIPCSCEWKIGYQLIIKWLLRRESTQSQQLTSPDQEWMNQLFKHNHFQLKAYSRWNKNSFNSCIFLRWSQEMKKEKKGFVWIDWVKVQLSFVIAKLETPSHTVKRFSLLCAKGQMQTLSWNMYVQ